MPDFTKAPRRFDGRVLTLPAVGGLNPMVTEHTATLRRHGLTPETLFFPADHRPADTEAGRIFLDRTGDFLGRHPG